MQRSEALQVMTATASILGVLPRSIGTLTSTLGANQNMAQIVETLLRENIFSVFGEHDAQKRQAKIAAIWADDGVFIVVPQPNARYEGHSGIEKAAADFIAQFPAFTFTEHGEAQTGSEVGMMPWAFGPPGADPIFTGIDVLVTKGDKIGAVYVFQNPPKK